MYTNVPVAEAIEDCCEFMYSGKYELPPVDRETFKELLTISSYNVLMLTHDGYYRQVDGLAMGSPPAPLISNGWLKKREAVICDDAKIFFRCMDDILRSIKENQITRKLDEINGLHSSLKFTIERENDRMIPFLDMKIK